MTVPIPVRPELVEGRGQQLITLREPQGDRWRGFIAELFAIVILLSLLLLLSGLAHAASLEERVIEHHLQNGLTLLVMERHHAPIVAVNLTYKVGGANEHSGITGVAHLYEHMAFKGTRTIGVTDAEKEKPVLEELDRLAEAIMAEKVKGPAADQTRLAALRK